MSAPASGRRVRQQDLPIIFGMLLRGDRRHDIAAWFGLNQGRIKEVQDGKYGSAQAAPSSQLFPPGSPGPRSRELRRVVGDVTRLLVQGGPGSVQTAIAQLQQAAADFDAPQ